MPTWPYHFMLLPGCILLAVFSYAPMFGLVMAFQRFTPARGFFNSPFVGLDNFRYLMTLPNAWPIIRNTLTISVGKFILGLLVTVTFAILLSEIRTIGLRRGIQTIVYLPHFLSWVILASAIVNLFNVDGIVPSLLVRIGFPRLNFLGNNDLFQPLLIFTDVWKSFGYGSIVYLAAITSIDPGLYEAASIDGASWTQKAWHITLPGMLTIILLMSVLNISSILSAGFDQVFNLYSPMVYERGDILDTYIYRVGLIGRQYSLGATVGLFKSVIGMTLLLCCNQVSKKFTDRRIF